jgi:hypothetical protein
MAPVSTDHEVLARISRMFVVLVVATLLTLCKQTMRSLEPPVISVSGELAPLIGYAYVIGVGLRALRSMPIVGKAAVITLVLVATLLFGIVSREVFLFGYFRSRGHWIGV